MNYASAVWYGTVRVTVFKGSCLLKRMVGDEILEIPETKRPIMRWDYESVSNVLAGKQLDIEKV